jgi:DNA adenine methylase
MIKKAKAEKQETIKTPISYYGGKQQLASRIIELLPQHNLYCEPFIGGAAVFFKKPPSVVEVINDTNQELINFYRIVQRDYVSLEKEIQISLHSRRLHKDASVVYNNPHLFSEIKRAWAVWVTANQSFGSQLDNSWGYDRKKGSMSKKIKNKRESFTEAYAIRLQSTQIECADALAIIRSRDSDDSLFYCDPPYPGTAMGHYDGYSIEDFEALLTLLSQIKGKFILSSYPYDVLDKYTQDKGWFSKRFEMTKSIDTGAKERKKKVEVLTANFEL